MPADRYAAQSINQTHSLELTRCNINGHDIPTRQLRIRCDMTRRQDKREREINRNGVRHSAVNSIKSDLICLNVLNLLMIAASYFK